VLWAIRHGIISVDTPADQSKFDRDEVHEVDDDRGEYTPGPDEIAAKCAMVRRMRGDE
jgi:hypothetical protein